MRSVASDIAATSKTGRVNHEKHFCFECHGPLGSDSPCGADIANGYGYRRFCSIACGDAHVARGGPKPTIAQFCDHCGNFSIELGKFGCCPYCEGEP